MMIIPSLALHLPFALCILCCSLGCGIGYGYLHRIPTLPFSDAPQVQMPPAADTPLMAPLPSTTMVEVSCFSVPILVAVFSSILIFSKIIDCKLSNLNSQLYYSFILLGSLMML